MTKTQAMDKIKELSKKLSAAYKAGQVSTGDYTDAYNSLNDALVMLNNTKYPDLAMEEAAWVADMLDNLPKAEPAPASGNTTAGMTQDEYDKQKKAMYQKYKAGEITNYAYIQWKKQNNPANQAQSGAVSAPVAKKAQTPAATQQAAKTASVGTKNAAKTAEEILGLTIADVIPDVGVYTGPLIAALNNGTITQEQYTKAMKKVVAGSNKWQKQQKAAQTAAQSAGQTASGMTQAEFDAKKKEMYQKYKNGEITNYAYIQWKKQNDPSKQGSAQTATAGAQAAKQAPAAPAASTAKQAAPAAAKPKGMTAEEYDELYDYLYTQKENGTITDSDLTDLIDFLNKAKDKGLSKDTTEYSLQIMVKNIAKNQAKAALPSFKLPDGPLDDNQKINYLQQLMALQKAGQVTGAEYNSFYDQIIAKNNEWHVNQAATSPEMKNIESKLLKAFTHGDLTEAEVDKLTDMVNDMFDQGKSAADAEKTLDMAMQMTIDNGDTVEDAMAAAGYKAGGAGNHTITEDEMQKFIAEVAKKYATGQITEKEYQALNKKLDDMWFASGSKPTLAEAEAAIGISLTAPATGGMTDADYKKKADQLVKSATKGDISYKEYKDAIQALKEQAEQDGLEITIKGGKATVTPVPKTPMTDAEYNALMEQITESGNKALTGEDIKKIEKLAEIMSEGKLSAKEAAAAIGMSGTPIQASADTVSNAESPITAEQLKELKKQLMQKYIDGEINQDLFDDIGWELDSEAKSGKSLKEVEEIMHASVLSNYINGIAVEGTIEYEETDTLNDLVEKMLAAGYDENDIKGKIDQIVEQSTDNGQPVEEAMAEIGINPDNIPPKTKGGKAMTAEQSVSTAKPMTQDEYDEILDDLKKKKKNGEITAEQLKEMQDKLDFAKGQDATLAEAKEAIGMAPVTQAQLNALQEQLLKNNTPFDEFSAIQDKLLQIQAQGGTFLQAQMAAGLDPGTLATKAAADALEQELVDVYGATVKDLQKNLQDFGNAYQAKLAKKEADLQNGKITQAEFDEWCQGQLKTSELLQAKVEQMSETLLHTNQKAVGMINGETLGVFAENANFQAYQITKDAGVNLSFAIYDENTVKKLIKDKPELLPRKVVNGKKDKAWNQKQIANAVTQAVLQGESIPKLAKRIATETASTNMKAMVRYARTAMTGAQNAGRMEMLHQAKGMGIKVKKRWLATLDKRTRHTHARLDGTTIDIDEKFKTDYGELLFPGDPEGHPGDVYNCRCTLIYDYEGFPNDPADDQRLYYDEYTTTEVDAKGNTKEVEHREAHLITDMNYDEWKAAKEASALNDLNIAKVTLANAQKAVLAAKISETKQYKDIWKDPVTLADYDAKKDAIQGKRDYYETEIQKYKDAIANGSSWATEDKLKELEKKLKALNEFEKNGKLLAERDKALATVQGIYDAAGFQKKAAIPSLEMAKPKAKKAEKKEKSGLGSLSQTIKDKLESYTHGEELKLDKKQLKSIKDAMELHEEPMYRVENLARISGKNMQIGQDFDFAQMVYESKDSEMGALRSFTKDKGDLSDIVGDIDDPVIFKTVGGTYQMDIESLSQYTQHESLCFGNKWKIVGKSTMEIDGQTISVIEIEQSKDGFKQHAKKDLKAAAGELKTQFAKDAWDEKTKKAALSFRSRTTADKNLRAELDKEWDTLTNEEKYAVWEYTHNSNPMNKPLSGYHDSWSRSNFLGFENTKWGYEDRWRSLPSNFAKYGKNGQMSYHKAITNLTKAIEKTVFKEDRWLVRGSDNGGLAGMLEGAGFDFNKMKKLLDTGNIAQIKKALVGQTAQNHAFTSTGIATDAGFTGEVMFRIYAPKGTKGVYAEPQSYYGNTISGAKLYRKGEAYNGVGSEAEVILQRGTKYVITDVKKTGSGIEVVMDIVEQPDYFQNGDEDTINGGKTRHKN